MELTRERLDEMAAVDIRTVDINTLTDLRDIEIDASRPVPQKIKAWVEQTNNIYIHRMGDYVVKVRYQEEGPSLNDKMNEYIRHLSRIYI